jgi:hypothetical protein
MLMGDTISYLLLLGFFRRKISNESRRFFSSPFIFGAKKERNCYLAVLVNTNEKDITKGQSCFAQQPSNIRTFTPCRQVTANIFPYESSITNQWHINRS